MKKAIPTYVPDPMILRTLLGSSEHFSLERRVLNAAIFVSAAISTTLIVETTIIGVSLEATFLVISAAAIFWICYGFGRKSMERNWLIWVYLIINMTILLIDWILIGGYSGIALPLVVVLTGILPLIAIRKQYLICIVLIGIVFSAFAVTAVLFHERIPQHAFTIKRVFDILFETAVLSLGLASMTYFVMRSYRHQKDTVQNFNLELIDLNKKLENQTQKLQQALQEVKTLQGIIPICAKCKKIRDSKGYWEQIEEYIETHTDALFSHGICTECAEKLYGDEDWFKKKKIES